MNKVIIIADSTCDLSQELVEKFDIKIIPLHVSFPKENNGRDYLDGVNIFPEEVYKKVEEYKETPKTGARNIVEFIEDFKKYINEGYDIIETGIGSDLSSTYNNACLAAKEFPEGRIEIVDSKDLSTGTGLLVLKIAKLRDEGLDIHQIAEKVRELVPNVSTKFCINELDYLYKGGRCSGMTKLFANVFNLHPIAKIHDGKLTVSKVIRGKYIKAIDSQIEEFKKDLPYIDKDHIFITHSGHMDGIEEYVYNKLKEYVDPSCLHITTAGCVISSHCGPKTLGILYILNK